MGYECMLEFAITDPSAVDAVLRGVAGFEGYDDQYRLYFFRRHATGSMPDAHVRLDEAGVYLCDNGCGFEVLHDIRSALGALAPEATIREL